MPPLICNTQKLFALCLFISILPACGPTQDTKSIIESKDSNTSQIPEANEEHANKQPVDLIYTEKEKQESSWDRWIKGNNQANLEEIVKAGFNGDRGALYLLGLCHLLGADGITIDVATADRLFGYSASLGFAPAIDKLRAKYLEESNPFLMAVYLNLSIALGHREFIKPYHNLRKEYLATTDALPIAQIIEEMAKDKMDIILQNKATFDDLSNKYKFVTIHMRDITADDDAYGEDFWNLIFYFHSYLKNNKLNELENLGYKQKAVAALSIKSISDAPDITDNKITNGDVKLYIEKHLVQLLKTGEGTLQALNEAQKLQEISIIRGDAAQNIKQKYPNIGLQEFKAAIEDATRDQINNIVNEFKRALQVYKVN